VRLTAERIIVVVSVEKAGMSKKKPARPLPRLFVPYNAHHLEKDDKGELHWVTVVIEVEVVSIHFTTNSMRVRSIEKIAWSNESARIRAFDLSYDEFFKHYDVVRR
jgi:hypothetical protein